jgi:hypothetical protein
MTKNACDVALKAVERVSSALMCRNPHSRFGAVASTSAPERIKLCQSVMLAGMMLKRMLGGRSTTTTLVTPGKQTLISALQYS